MSYREELYSAYVTTHTSILYGHATLGKILAQFPTWNNYFRKFLPANHDAKILDIGCGSGGFVYFLHQAGYHGAEGVDFSPEQVELARQLKIRGITCSDLTAFLTDKRDAYDVVFARDVIEHFEKDEVMAILAAVHQALKPGGTFVVQVPNAESPMSGRLRYGDFTHENGFTRSSLNQIFTASGYPKVQCYATGPTPKGIKSVVRFFLWKAIESALRFYLLVESGSVEGIFTQTIIAAASKGEWFIPTGICVSDIPGQ